MDQAACQDYCLSTDTCVGICVSHEFSEYEHCVVCYGESFVDNYDGYGFHRRQGTLILSFTTQLSLFKFICHFNQPLYSFII